MKNNKKLFISIEAIMAVMVIAMAFIMLKENSKKDLHKISVIVPNSNDNQWTAFKYGLKMAAEDQDTEIFFVSTGNISSAEEETNIIKREIENGTDALIIKPVPDNKIENILKKKHYDPEKSGRKEKEKIFGYLTRKGFRCEDIFSVAEKLDIFEKTV